MGNWKEGITILDSILSIIVIVLPFIGVFIRKLINTKESVFKKKKSNIDLSYKQKKDVGDLYWDEFKQPILRENDFYEETGIRTDDKDILRFNALKKFLGYTKWESLRLAQNRISFIKNKVVIKWNKLDEILMWLAGIISAGLFLFFISLILTFVPLLLNKEAVENAKVADLRFILFVFVVSIGYLFFFLYMLRKPVAVYFIKKGVDKFGDKIHYTMYKGIYNESLTVGDRNEEIQVNMTSKNKEFKRSFTPDELIEFLNILKENDKLISENKKEKKKGKSKKKKK